jgi:hypothetical protein
MLMFVQIEFYSFYDSGSKTSWLLSTWPVLVQKTYGKIDNTLLLLLLLI